jgi:NitT/TauT family transport system ATP-binding protein
VKNFQALQNSAGRCYDHVAPVPTSASEGAKYLSAAAKTNGRGERISLTIHIGEFVCLLGPSGCGKSTLLRIIAGLNTSTSVTVLNRGTKLAGVNPHATIVFQTFALYPWLTVLENVEVALKARGVPAAQRQEKALRLIDTVGLDGFESAYPRELSGAASEGRICGPWPWSLSCSAWITLLRPCALCRGLRSELMELWQNHTIPTRAILMVTHNIEEAVLMADRIVVMAKDPGHIVAEINITLRHPRQRKDTAFQSQVDRVYAAVTGKRLAAAEANGMYAKMKLPRAHLNALAGLVEKVLADGGRTAIA